MRKFLLLLLIVILVVVGAGLYYIKIHGEKILEEHLSEALGVPVTIERLHIGWNHIKLSDCRISNPEAGHIDYAFIAPEIRIDLNFLSLFTHEIEVSNIFFKNPTIGIELYNLSGTDNNWNRLIGHIPHQEEKTANEKTIYIEHLLIEPLNIQLYNKPTSNKPVFLDPIPKIDLHNIGSRNDALPLNDALNIIAQAIITAVSNKVGLTNLLYGVFQFPGNSVEKILSPVDKVIKTPFTLIKKLFGG